MNASSAFRFAPFLALFACAASVASMACGSGQDKTTFLVYGEGTGPGSFTVSGGASASGAYGSCHATAGADVFGGSVTTVLTVRCDANDISPKLEIDIALPTSPIVVGTYDTAMTLAADDTLILNDNASDGGVATKLSTDAVQSITLTVTGVGDDTTDQTVTGSVDAVFLVSGIATPIRVQASF